MKKNKTTFLKAMFYRTLIILFVFTYGMSLASLKDDERNLVTNVNGVKSIEAMHIVNRYDNSKKTLEVVHVNNMKEAATFGPDKPIAFTGQMTAYKATCVGCTGRVACPPGQDVRNGNIWFNDNNYQKIRILAADRSIPCGTIVKITNVSFSDDEIIGIVLDRGGAIKGNIMDFLMAEDEDMDIVGRQYNVNYEVLRWGW